MISKRDYLLCQSMATERACSHEDPALVEAGLQQTLEDLNLDYLDLYLMHWPVGSESGTRGNHLDYVEVMLSLQGLCVH